MRQWLKKVPGLRSIRRSARKVRKAYDGLFGVARLRRTLAASPLKQIVIGAGAKREPGWIRTQIEFLNLLEPTDWESFFQPDSIDAMLAEHVWEHLTLEEGRAAAKTCFKYLKAGAWLRVAVPDGFHPNPTYVEWVKVGGASPGQIANGHKVLYTYRALAELFETCGFEVVLYEYFDETGTFHYHDWDEKAGKIWRSKRFDPRNRGGELVFTSIILDAIKKPPSEPLPSKLAP